MIFPFLLHLKFSFEYSQISFLLTDLVLLFLWCWFVFGFIIFWFFTEFLWFNFLCLFSSIFFLLILCSSVLIWTRKWLFFGTNAALTIFVCALLVLVWCFFDLFFVFLGSSGLLLCLRDAGFLSVLLDGFLSSLCLSWWVFDLWPLALLDLSIFPGNLRLSSCNFTSNLTFASLFIISSVYEL